MPKAGQGRSQKATAAEIVLLEPEVEDAQRLKQTLPDDVVSALERAVKKLPGDAGKEAETSSLLNLQVRHQLIVRLKAQGMMDDRIARSIGVSKRTVERVVTNYWKAKKEELDQQDMEEFVLLLAEGYLEDIDRLTDIVRSSSHSSAVVGAIKARQEARQQYVELLADFGFLKRKPKEIDVNVEGAGDTNVLVVDPAVLQQYSKEWLAQQRLESGEVSDGDLGDFIVSNDPAS